MSIRGVFNLCLCDRVVRQTLVRLVAGLVGLVAAGLGFGTVGFGVLALAGGTAALATVILPGAMLIPVGWYGVMMALPDPGHDGINFAPPSDDD